MDIHTLCEEINLQPEIKSRVLAFSKDFDFTTVAKQLKDFRNYKKMSELPNINNTISPSFNTQQRTDYTHTAALYGAETTASTETAKTAGTLTSTEVTI